MFGKTLTCCVLTPHATALVSWVRVPNPNPSVRFYAKLLDRTCLLLRGCQTVRVIVVRVYKWGSVGTGLPSAEIKLLFSAFLLSASSTNTFPIRLC